MTSKHTPGPWVAQQNNLGDWYIWHRKPDAALAHVYSPVTLGRGEPEANARLIAAAPALLEALQGLFEYHYRDDYIGQAKEYQEKARAAIAQALGEGVHAE